MSETHTATPTEYDGASTMPEDGDPLTAASVRDALEEHDDGLAKVTNKLYDAETCIRHHWRPRPLVNCVLAPYTDAAADFDAYLHGGIVPIGAGDYVFEVEFDLPHGSLFNSVRVYGYNIEVGTVLKIFQVDLDNYTDHGGDIDELPAVTVLATSSTVTIIDGVAGRVGVNTGSNPTVDRARYRYVAQVHGVAAATPISRWHAARFQVEAREMDKAAG